ncbi:hypothetical protein E8D34_04920 [Nocardioides sp. GY 10113]|uniref:hypothetical protein n=1 Tax=Nocardioides sp. GY 10113 TaxID=2569761 RepID=UPI0010A7622B|nr:hypothetical protein [Nocardioides sp. GY 10113]TIC88285.1 hypothetical protein E8D34_04920 [Nocardioides sp. GY 10113]
MPLRIGLLQVPELLADVVRSAFGPGVAEFEDLTDAATVRDPATGHGHDAVIAGVAGAWEPEVLRLKSSHPGLIVLGLRHDARQTWLYELVPHPRPLGELGTDELRAAVLTGAPPL